MKQELDIGVITLEWSGWVPWAHVQRSQIPLAPGVYEVRHQDHAEGRRLYIGEGRDIQRRVFAGMLRNSHHAAGAIAAEQDVSRVDVRWAATPRHKAAEEELVRAYVERFGELPDYAERKRRIA